MRSTGALLGAAVIATVAEAQQGVVKWDIEKRHNPQALRRIRRADGTVVSVIDNKSAKGGYFATCKLGTPPQTLDLQLDTGSSDIWVPDTAARVCQSTQTGGCDLGSFAPSESSTFQTVGQGLFNISYVDGTGATGNYITDVFRIGGASLTNMTMGLGLKTDIPNGLVGIGYAVNEAIVGTTESLKSVYPNLPVNMVDEGLINTIAYSLWLNDLDASSGSILFGGIDTEKYKGTLTRIKIYPTQDNIFAAFVVALTSLSAQSPSGSDVLTSSAFPIPVVLDSGTTLTYLPTDLASQIWKEVGALYSPEIQLAVVPCQLASSKGTFSFGFAGPSGPTVSVGMDELVLDLTSGQPPVFKSGPYEGMTVCEFGIQNSSAAPYLLGDTFLRSAYVVYDLVNNQVGIAETDFNATGSNVVAFASSGAPIPSATVAPDQGAVTQVPAATSPGYAAGPGFTDSAGMSAASGRGAGLGAVQALVVGVVMGVALVGPGGLFL